MKVIIDPFDIKKVVKEGQLSFFNSTVSLGDLNSDSERNGETTKN